MNLRHATALALVGWYLMTPPIQGNSDTDIHLHVDAPLLKWNNESSHDTASECQEALAQMKQMAANFEPGFPLSKWANDVLETCKAIDRRGFGRDQGGAEVERRWVRRKIGPFSSRSIAR